VFVKNKNSRLLYEADGDCISGQWGIGLVLDSVWALSAGTARAWFARSPRRLAVLGTAGGVSIVGLGVGLATTSRATG